MTVEFVEFVPCPTGGCYLDAELELRMDDALMHTRCPQGHDNSLAPAVLAHLRSLAAPHRPEHVDNGWPGVDRCGQADPERLDP